MQVSRFSSSLHLRRPGSVLAAVVLTLVFGVSGAWAQMPKVFVSLEGSDGNAGTSMSPKRTFQAAHDAVNAGGEIVVLDTAGYGALTITKSLTITVPTGANGFVTVNGANNGITISAGAADNVSIRGLTIESDGTTGGTRGIDVEGVGQLDVEGCTIRSFGTGIFLNAITGNVSAIVSDCVIRDCSSGFDSQAVTGGDAATAVLTGVTVNNCGTGFFTVNAGGAYATTTLVRCIAHACVFGINTGAGGTTYADNCTISGSILTGVAGNGVNYTRNNNLFTNNASNGTFTGSVTAL